MNLGKLKNEKKENDDLASEVTNMERFLKFFLLSNQMNMMDHLPQNVPRST